MHLHLDLWAPVVAAVAAAIIVATCSSSATFYESYL